MGRLSLLLLLLPHHLPTLPLPVPSTKIASNASRAGVIASTATLTFGREPPLPILPPINNILQPLPLAGLGDFRPIEVFAGLGVIYYIGHCARADLALAARGGGGAGVEVAGGVDCVLIWVCSRRRGGRCARTVVREGGEVGLEVRELARLRGV